MPDALSVCKFREVTQSSEKGIEDRHSDGLTTATDDIRPILRFKSEIGKDMGLAHGDHAAGAVWG